MGLPPLAARALAPVDRITRTARRISAQDLSARLDLPATDDEVGRLAATFDEMTGQLEERTDALEEALGRLRAILSSIGDGVALEDLSGNFVPLNATAEIMLKELADEYLDRLGFGDVETVTYSVSPTGRFPAEDDRVYSLISYYTMIGVLGGVQVCGARTIDEAILWHGGEAQASADRFRRLPANQRAELVAFLEAL